MLVTYVSEAFYNGPKPENVSEIFKKMFPSVMPAFDLRSLAQDRWKATYIYFYCVWILEKKGGKVSMDLKLLWLKF